MAAENQTNPAEEMTQPMLLSRRQRRFMLKQRGLMKYISKLSFFNETKTAVRKENMDNGKKLHNMHLDNVERMQSENLEATLNSMKETWSNIGYNAEEIAKLEEAWAMTTVKDKETYREDKKRARLLMREAQESLQARNA
jgi:hypothetical protein